MFIKLPLQRFRLKPNIFRESVKNVEQNFHNVLVLQETRFQLHPSHSFSIIFLSKSVFPFFTQHILPLYLTKQNISGIDLPLFKQIQIKINKVILCCTSIKINEGRVKAKNPCLIMIFLQYFQNIVLIVDMIPFYSPLVQ